MTLDEHIFYWAFLIFSMCAVPTLFMSKLKQRRLFFFMHGWALAVMVSLPVWLLNVAWAILFFDLNKSLESLAYITLFSVGGLSFAVGFILMDIFGPNSFWAEHFSSVVFVVVQTALVAWFYSRHIFHIILQEEPETSPSLRFFLWHRSIRPLWIIFFCNSLVGLAGFFLYAYVLSQYIPF
jgi:hypothetical protein